MLSFRDKSVHAMYRQWGCSTEARVMKESWGNLGATSYRRERFILKLLLNMKAGEQAN